MRLLPIIVILSMMLIPASHVLAQDSTRSDSTLSVITGDNPFVYQDSDGNTFVVGEIKNTNTLTAVSDVLISVTFFDEFGNTVDTVQGTTALDIIGPGDASPYIISSSADGSQIKRASVMPHAFNSSPAKEKGLDVEVTAVRDGGELVISGTIQNKGNTQSQNTTAYLSFYDVFDPPRTVQIESAHIGDIAIDGTADFEISVTPISRAVGVKITMESDLLQSETSSIKIPKQTITTLLVTISEPAVTDADGRSVSVIPIGATVNITSVLSFETIADDRIQPFVYYAQVKQSGTIPAVEFIDSMQGVFYGTLAESAHVQWSPERQGLYFIETYVWDNNAVPIASKGPIVLVHVG